VKPLHPLLRPLSVYGGHDPGDGQVALILSGEGIARHSGIAHRTTVQRPALPAARSDADTRTVLVFRCGPVELLALPLSSMRRVVMIPRERIECIGDRELIHIEGVAINVLRLDRFLELSPCPARDSLFLILPRHSASPVGLLASELWTRRRCRATGIRGLPGRWGAGSMLIRDQIAVCLDLDRILEMWDQAPAHRAPLCRGASQADTRGRRHSVLSPVDQEPPPERRLRSHRGGERQ